MSSDARSVTTVSFTPANQSTNMKQSDLIPGIVDPIARMLAQMVAGMKPAAVPEAIRLRACHLMLDAIGCALASRGEEFARRGALAVSSLDGAANADASAPPVIGFAQRLPMRDAMLLNGLLCHGLDYDDTHVEGVVHLGVSLVPAVLALGSRPRPIGTEVFTP